MYAVQGVRRSWASASRAPPSGSGRGETVIRRARRTEASLRQRLLTARCAEVRPGAGVAMPSGSRPTASRPPRTTATRRLSSYNPSGAQLRPTSRPTSSGTVGNSSRRDDDWRTTKSRSKSVRSSGAGNVAVEAPRPTCGRGGNCRSVRPRWAGRSARPQTPPACAHRARPSRPPCPAATMDAYAGESRGPSAPPQVSRTSLASVTATAVSPPGVEARPSHATANSRSSRAY